MSDHLAISVRNVSKAYRMWATPGARLTTPVVEGVASLLRSPSLRERATARYRDFWALTDISFDVARGEAVGIIGKNGSGKSTLLQVIAGTLQPSSGAVQVRGRIAALLELGSGFNPDFTGRENVYLNGAVLGLARREIDARFDAIARFADIGDFIEQPVKTYSSGMMMRLAFAVQTSVDPEILIIDESLAVGDAQFIAKCINRISDFIRSGRTLLFVSHEVGLVKQLTARALFLDRGRAVTFGSTPETVLAYTNSLALESEGRADPDRYAAPEAPYRIDQVLLCAGPAGAATTVVSAEQPATLAVRLVSGTAVASRLVFSIYNYMGIIVTSAETELPEAGRKERILDVAYHFPSVRLAPGNYRVNCAVRRGFEIVAWARNAVHFTVVGTTSETYIYREHFSTSVEFSG